MSHESSPHGEEPSEQSVPQFPILAGTSGGGPAAASFNELLAKVGKERSSLSKDALKKELTRLADFAHEWMLHDEKCVALELLAQLHMQHREPREAIKELTRLVNHQTKVYGSEHACLAKSHALLGECYRRDRHLDFATRYLREAVVRYQCADVFCAEEFVEALCQLSHVYRESSRQDLAKIAVKQALNVVSDSELLQARLLDEFGSLLYDTHEFDSAVTVFANAIAMRQRVLGPAHPSTIKSLVALAMAHYSRREFDLAVKYLMQAGLIAENSGADNPTRAEIFAKLAGTFRVLGRMTEAGMIDDAEKEFIGGQTEICLYMEFRKDMEAGFAAEKADMWDRASKSYRQALCILEPYRHRNTGDRIAILIRLQMAAERRKNLMQAKTLVIEIEEELLGMFGSRRMTLVEAAVSLAGLFQIQGKNVAADAFLLYAEKLCRETRSNAQIADICQERAAILLQLNQYDEARRVEKLSRRLRPNRAIGMVHE